MRLTLMLEWSVSDEMRALDERWVDRIRGWALETGFASLGVADVDLRDAEPGLLAGVSLRGESLEPPSP